MIIQIQRWEENQSLVNCKAAYLIDAESLSACHFPQNYRKTYHLQSKSGLHRPVLETAGEQEKMKERHREKMIRMGGTTRNIRQKIKEVRVRSRKWEEKWSKTQMSMSEVQL